MTDQLTAGYEGTEPFPGGGSTPRTFEGGIRVAVTAAIVVVPFGALAVAVWLAWGHGLRLTDILPVRQDSGAPPPPSPPPPLTSPPPPVPRLTVNSVHAALPAMAGPGHS